MKLILTVGLLSFVLLAALIVDQATKSEFKNSDEVAREEAVLYSRDLMKRLVSGPVTLYFVCVIG